MAIGSWNAYPWGASTGQTIHINYDNSTAWDYNSGGYYYHTGGSAYQYHWPVQQQIAEKIETAMDWLKRRVTEITDLAYAEV